MTPSDEQAKIARDARREVIDMMIRRARKHREQNPESVLGQAVAAVVEEIANGLCYETVHVYERDTRLADLKARIQQLEARLSATAEGQ